MAKDDFSLDVVSVRLVSDTPVFSEQKIDSPETAIKAVAKLLGQFDREVVCVINLKTDGTPINCSMVSMGSVNYSLAHPREMLKSSILSNAANMILLHNHPSNKLTPSKDDTRMTDRMLKVSELIGIPLLDHVIVGPDVKEFFSFREKGMIVEPNIPLQTDYHFIDWDKTAVAEERGGR